MINRYRYRTIQKQIQNYTDKQFVQLHNGKSSAPIVVKNLKFEILYIKTWFSEHDYNLIEVEDTLNLQ